MTRIAIRRTFAAVVVAVAFTLGACSTGGTNPSVGAEPPDDEQSQALAFAECMRDNGVDMADPGPGQRGLILALRAAEQAVGREAIDRAIAGCESLLPRFGHDGADPRQNEELMLALAECLREEGFDVSDDLNELRAHDAADTAEFQAALAECRSTVFGGGR
jgi:hypothetical protein